MRKSTKVISGLGVVAGLGMALAPLAVFADNTTPTRTDNLNITNSEACSINTVALDASQQTATSVAVVNNYDWQYAPGTEHDFTRRESGEGGNATEGVFTIICNYSTGYKIVADVTDPTGTGGTILAGTSGDQYWSATVATVTGNITPVATVATPFAITTDGQRILYNSGSSAASGDSFTMSYAAKTAADTPAGTYTGNVVYTLVKGASES